MKFPPVSWFKLSAAIHMDGSSSSFAVIPDWAFALMVPAAGGRLKSFAYLAELDRGSAVGARRRKNHV